MRDIMTVATPARAARGLDHDWPAVGSSAVGLMFSVGTLLLYSFGVFVRPLAAEFDWSRTQLSGAVAISQYALALSSPFWGLMTDRFGPRAILLPAVVLMSALFASLALLTPHLWHFYLVFAAIPLVAGGASPLGYSAVLIRRFDLKLGQALGIALMGVGLGATILPLLAQALLAEWGWRGAYAVLGALTLLVTFPAALVATRDVPGRAFRAAGDGPSIMALARTRTFLLMCAAFILLGVISVGTLAHLVPMMADRGLAPAAAAQVAGLTGLAAVVARGGLGWVLDRVHAPYLLACVAVVAIASFLLLIGGAGAVSGYFAAILLGCLAGAEVDFISFLVRRYFGPAVFGRLYGIAFGLFILGSGTGPLVLGASFDRLGSYEPGLLLFCGLAGLVAVIALVLPAYAPASASTASATARQ